MLRCQWPPVIPGDLKTEETMDMVEVVDIEMCNSCGRLFDERDLTLCSICGQWTCWDNDVCECVCPISVPVDEA
jgi:hypothetical protein